MERVETLAAIGVVLVEAEAPSVVVEVSPRLRALRRGAEAPVSARGQDAIEELVRAPEPVDEVLLTDMLNVLPPDWAKRRRFYQSRERLPGLREEPASYAAAERLLGSLFDRTV